MTRYLIGKILMHHSACYVSLCNIAVHIQATDYVTVHVANVGDWSTGVYLALPLDVIGSFYYVMSYVTSDADHGPSQFAIISTADQTFIQIDLVNDIDLNVVDASIATPTINRSTKLTLNKYQTFQVITF